MPKKLSERSRASLADVTTPGHMVCPADLASAGIIGSYSGIRDWIRKGWIAPPRKLPNGRMYWTGENIVDALRHRRHCTRKS
jgi:hypothetical protein